METFLHAECNRKAVTYIRGDVSFSVRGSRWQKFFFEEMWMILFPDILKAEYDTVMLLLEMTFYET
jgi:hypothetical protein